ncbi:pseudouridine synthase [Nocardioides sp. Root122]|uniref:tRNA pseudouridine(38-40) synthase TruA n=1 Tax=Nocardioides TaxID=1839 RepID=UPI000702718C|nr:MULTISPECIES: tRNA pseudouridine(38-40) synthase TruA [Nocardioides]KQV72659.1 pseudouridine synthase [Nocardioides sp. Root122]MCK9825383.1 tRNA pseudouridine(38-40) synthase TruA [Nocardioides cavernae]
MRLRIDCAYDGADFSGWAAQPGLRTVQGTLETALATALRVSDVRVTVAGRTDAGVHARGQVTHLDVDHDVVVASAGRSSDPPLDALARRVDGILPPDLRVRRVSEAPAGFDARFSATWRRYAYRIADAQSLADPLVRGFVLTWPRHLDVEAMNQASAPLVGLQDFAAFCKQREGATTVRTLLDLVWRRDDAGLVVGDVRADAFCHNMVRALVGSLIAVGEGRKPVGWPAEVMAGRRRDAGVRVVHAHGLTLEEVGYPDDAELAAQADRARARREAIDA